VPTAVVYWFLCPFIFVKQFPDDPWIPRFFALSIPLTLYAGLLLPIFQGAGDFRRWNFGRLLRGGVWALLVVVLALSARLSVPVLLLVQLGIYALMIAYLAPMVGRLPAREPEEDPAGSMGRIFRYGWAIFLSGIAYMVNQQLDQLLLSLWVSPAELGQYAAAVTLSGALLLVPAAVGPIVFSRMARSADEPSLQWRHQRQALLLTAVLLVPSGLCLAALGPFVTRLVYGAAFERAGEVLRILAPATVFLGVAHTLGDVLRGAGRPMDTTYGFTAGAVLTIGGLAWALPRFGILGAAWVSFFAYCAMMAVQLHFLRRWKTKQVQTAPSPTIP
jgi:O-antigen/teichoic acid export membrane protein